MTQQRNVETIIHSGEFHWVGNGFRVVNYFPSNPELGRRMNPYVLLDYHAPFNYPPSAGEPRGVGAHPHRGFETVTLAFEGSVAHHDSLGHAGVIEPGDVQWMTAASGILHKEYHERAFAEAGGVMHMAQIWVNLPKAHKMDAPGYQAIAAGQIGLAALPDSAGEVRVIAGEYRGTRGPARTFSPINLFEIRVNPNGHVHLDFPTHENTGLLVLAGDVSLNGKLNAAALDFVLFENKGTSITIQAPAGAHMLVLNGEPIDEPVVQYGPFVMNTEQEIREAIADFRGGKFGQLEG